MGSPCEVLLESNDERGFYNAIPIRRVTRPPLSSGLTMDRSVMLPEDGSVSGSAGCNNYATTYEISGDQIQNLFFGQFA